jgi:hypothetical protein
MVYRDDHTNMTDIHGILILRIIYFIPIESYTRGAIVMRGRKGGIYQENNMLLSKVRILKTG